MKLTARFALTALVLIALSSPNLFSQTVASSNKVPSLELKVENGITYVRTGYENGRIVVHNDNEMNDFDREIKNTVPMQWVQLNGNGYAFKDGYKLSLENSEGRWVVQRNGNILCTKVQSDLTAEKNK
jgi:hypothetical protein